MVQGYVQQPIESPRGSTYSDTPLQSTPILFDWFYVFQNPTNFSPIYEYVLDYLSNELKRFDSTTNQYYRYDIKHVYYSHSNQNILDAGALMVLPTDDQSLQDLQNSDETYKITVYYNEPWHEKFTTCKHWLEQNKIFFQEFNDRGLWKLGIFFGNHERKNVEIIAVRKGVFEIVVYEKHKFKMSSVYNWKQRVLFIGFSRVCVDYMRLFSEESMMLVLEHIWDAYKEQIRHWQPENTLEDGNGSLFDARPRAKNPELDEQIQKEWYTNLNIGSWEERKKEIDEWNSLMKTSAFSDDWLDALVDLDCLHKRLLRVEIHVGNQ